MLERLKLVRGAVADKNIVQALTHFFIYDGRVQGSNSRIAIDAALPELAGHTLTVHANKFISVIDRCDDYEQEPTFDVSEKSLTVKAGRFRVKLPLLDNASFPRTIVDAQEWEPDEPLLPILRMLRPFVASDANQVWPLGVWVDENGWAYATNNVCLVRVPCSLLSGTGMSFNLPGYAIDEMLRIGQEPTGFSITEQAVTFHYDELLWIKSQQINVPWPMETVRTLFEAHYHTDASARMIPDVPDGLYEAVDTVLPFVANEKFPVVVFEGGAVATEDGESRAMVDGFKLPDAKYNAHMLKLVLTYATRFAPSASFNLFMINDAEGIFTSLRQ